jgi:hypothetical protein
VEYEYAMHPYYPNKVFQSRQSKNWRYKKKYSCNLMNDLTRKTVFPTYKAQGFYPQDFLFHETHKNSQRKAEFLLTALYK